MQARTGGEGERVISLARRLLILALVVLGSFLLGFEKPWHLESGPGFVSPSGRSLRDTVFAAGYWAAVVNAALCLLLLATVKLWGRPRIEADRAPAAGRGRRGVGFWLLLAAAGVLALGLRLPLASGSLWWDEAWSIRRVVVGPVTPDPQNPEQLVVERPPWSRPFWDYRKPTNHVFYNVLGRLSVDTWRAMSGEPEETFDELAFRLPSLVAAVASVVLIGVLVAEWGFPHAAVAAALMLALHPWHVRYGAEARAYGQLLLFAILACLTLTRALGSGAWRHWLLYGASQFGLLWSQPTGIYLTFVLGVCGVLGALGGPGPWRDRWTVVFRFTIVNLLAGMLFLQMMAPNIAQSMAWTDVHQQSHRVGLDTVADLWARLSTGVPLHTAPEANPREAFPSVGDLAGGGGSKIVLGLLPLIALLGLVRLLAQPSARWPLLGLVGGVVLALWWTRVQEYYYYHRFVIYGLAAVVPALCVGVHALARLLPRNIRAPAGAALLGIGLAAYQLLVAPQSAVLLTRPFAPMRDVAEFLQEQAEGDPLAVLRVGLGLGGEMPRIYDPWLQLALSEAEFSALRAEADRSGRPFFVTYGYPGQNRPRQPEVFELLDDPSLFTEVADFLGIEPQLHYWVLRYNPPEAAPAMR